MASTNNFYKAVKTGQVENVPAEDDWSNIPFCSVTTCTHDAHLVTRDNGGLLVYGCNSDHLDMALETRNSRFMAIKH